MTVKTKLRLIFALFFALLGGLTYYGSSGLKLLEGELLYVSSEVTPQVKRLEELNTNVAEFRIDEASHILSLAPADMDAREADMKRLASEIDALSAEFLNGSVSDAEKQTFAAFQDAWKKYLEVNAKLLPISRHVPFARAYRFPGSGDRDLQQGKHAAVSGGRGAAGRAVPGEDERGRCRHRPRDRIGGRAHPQRPDRGRPRIHCRHGGGRAVRAHGAEPAGADCVTDGNARERRPFDHDRRRRAQRRDRHDGEIGGGVQRRHDRGRAPARRARGTAAQR